MAVYRKELQRKRFPVLSKPAGVTQYEELAERALGNSINHLNMAYSQKLSGAEGAVELRDEGVYTYDNQGRRYLDCLGGYGIFNVGHRHPKVINAVKAQLDQVALHSQELINPWAAHLASQLAAIAPGDLQYCFFGNSGSEAVEGAIKLARLYTGKTEIISTKNAYHGVTMGALSATGRDVFRKPFEPLLNGFVHVQFGDIAALEAAINENTAAVILEPIQGEGGINVPSAGYLRKVRQLTKKKGVLLILDEVQTGMGRTGRMFACEHEGVVPDILCLAKALGGGVMPIGCFMSSAKIWKVLEANPTIHNSTFGGNPLACSAASATVEVLLEEHLPARAAVMGNYFMRKLNELQERYPAHLADVRGRGLLIGLEFTSKELREAVQVELFYRGVLVAGTLNANRTFRIEPPLIITESQINFMIEALESILVEIGPEQLAQMHSQAQDEIQQAGVKPARRPRKVAAPLASLDDQATDAPGAIRKRILQPVRAAKAVRDTVKKSAKKAPNKISKDGRKKKSKASKSAYKARGKK